MHQAQRYNQMLEQDGAPAVIIPDAAEIKRLVLSDPFWNVGDLSHPDEAWAVDQATKDGIQAYLHKSRANEEVRQVARECRQLMHSAFASDLKLQALWDSLRESSKYCMSLVIFSFTGIFLIQTLQTLDA